MSVYAVLGRRVDETRYRVVGLGLGHLDHGINQGRPLMYKPFTRMMQTYHRHVSRPSEVPSRRDGPYT